MLTNGFHEVPTGKLAMVVTHLEMRARADTRPVPNPDKVEIHPIENITVDEYLDLYRRIGENWLWFSRLNMNEIELSQIIDDPKVVFFTLMKNGWTNARHCTEYNHYPPSTSFAQSRADLYLTPNDFTGMIR